MKINKLSPREFLRARRPERFSDSVPEERTALDRSLLEYHLDTLTSRSQEINFATFARHLVEREICPNLLPQTGPTGGGDSKVDSETYPVSEDLTLGWWVGIGSGAATERWAFAFSAKKKWASKVRADVAKAVGTRRGYRKIFFVSNQYVRDKARGELEDELSAKYGVDVRIFDRTWILDKVFADGHEAVAVEDLELKIAQSPSVRKGPRDVQREADLEKLESRINEALHQQRLGFQLVEDCIATADLARQLERPRHEVDGLFQRAEQTASRYGTEHQRLNCAYQKAWTAYWWYEDFEQFADLYGEVEKCAKGSESVYELELLNNLWTLLHTAVMTGSLDEQSAAYQERTATLASELDRLAQDDQRPSTALQARTLSLLTEFHLKYAEDKPVDSVLHGLRDLVHECEGLAGYPLNSLVKIVEEMGENVHGAPAYDELFELLVNLSSERKGEVSAARMLLERATQQFRAGHPYETIRTVGRALRKLHKHESRHDLVRALYLCGCAYERVALLWAARGALLAAASHATAELHTYGEVTHAQAACYGRLKWLEIQLGRLPQILAWQEADLSVRAALAARGADDPDFNEREAQFDLALGIVLLKTDLWELKWLSKLPDALERLGLFGSSAALTFALGYELELSSDEKSAIWREEDPRTLALRWRDQPASGELPPRPLLYEGRKVTLGSNILGCSITAESENVSPCVELAESILAALEALLSTGTVDEMMAREPRLTVELRKSDFASRPFEFRLQERMGRPHLEVLCSDFSPHNLTKDAQADIKKTLVDLLCQLMARIVMSDDPLLSIERLFRDELALERSIDFTGSFVTVGNVLGSNPKNRISKWVGPEDHDYPLKRAVPWDADAPPSKKKLDQEPRKRPFAMGEGDPPQEVLDHSGVKHTQIQTVSLIRESLWEKADWVGTLFGTSPDGSESPLLALVFRNPQLARQIFLDWRNDLGIRDPQGQLRITIVRGVEKAEPYSYRVLVGSNPEAEFDSENVRFAAFVARVHTMHPQSIKNLDGFLQGYEKSGEYFFTAAFTEAGRVQPKIIWDCHLVKRELSVREAWEIGRNDLDAAAIQADDNPIIPAGKVRPPVINLLQWKRERAGIQGPIVTGPKQKVGRNDPCPCGSGKKYKKCHGS